MGDVPLTQHVELIEDAGDEWWLTCLALRVSVLD